MFRISFILFFSLYSLSCFSQTLGNTSTFFNEVTLLQHLQNLSSDAFEGRQTGTKGAIKAKNYIINQFDSLGVKPLKKSFEQHFNFTFETDKYKGSNILGIIKGSEKPSEYIVVSAHYDHLGVKNGEIFNGADDNASGLSALFSFAEYFIKNPPKHSVILAAFDAEELGIRGSKYFIKNPLIPLKKITINLNMDMISRSDKNELFVAGTTYHKSLKKLVLNVEANENAKLVLGHDGNDGLENWTYASDHGPFYKVDIPFLYFGVEDHKDYHKSTDNFKNIHPEFYKDAVKLIISVFEKVDKNLF